eukprot:m.722167 g.722167  ORF g.722167 m.722167 type:complete len:975 (+) comp23017_c0_seq8:70-2994(+)
MAHKVSPVEQHPIGNVNDPDNHHDSGLYYKYEPASYVGPFVGSKFKAWGTYVATHPHRVIKYSMFITMLTLLGFINFALELRNEEVFPPSGSWAHDSDDAIFDHFGEERFAQVLVLPKSTGENLLTVEVLREMYSIDQAIRNVSKHNFTDLCIKRASNTPCYTMTPLAYFECFDGTATISPCAAAGSPGVLNNINAAAAANALHAVFARSGARDALGFPLPLTALVSPINATGIVPTQIDAFMMIYMLQESERHEVEMWPVFDFDTEEWEADFSDVILEWDAKADSAAHVLAYTRRSETDAVIDTALGNAVLALICIVVMVVYMIIALDNLPVALFGMMTICMGIFSGFAWGCAFDLPLTLASQLTFFTVLGISADGVLLVYATYHATPKDMPVPERLSTSLEHAGGSITAATLTDVFAFATVILSSFPMMRYFAVTTMMALIMDFFLLFTAFSAFVVINDKRSPLPLSIKARCMASRIAGAVSGKKAPAAGSSTPATTTPTSGNAGPSAEEPASEVVQRYQAEQTKEENRRNAIRSKYNTKCHLANELAARNHKGLLQRLVENIVAPITINPKSQYVIVVAFLVLFALSLTKVSDVKDGYDIGEIVEHDHEVYHFVENSNQNFASQSGFFVAFATLKTTYADPAELVKVQQVIDTVKNSTWFDGNTVDAWLPMFKQWLGATQSAADLDPATGYPLRTTFYTLLSAWLQTAQGKFYQRELDFASNGDLEAARFRVQQMPTPTQDDGKDALEEAKRISELAPVPTVAFTTSYIYDEMFLVLRSELVSNIAIAGAVVAIVVALFLPVKLSIIVTLGVAFVDLELLATMAVTDINLNPISLGTLILALGLAVDYVLHIAHAVTLQCCSVDDKIRNALAAVGVSTINGGLTTFLGVFVLFFSPAEGFRIFSTLLIMIVVLGALHGVLFFPSTLSGTTHIKNRCAPPPAALPTVLSVAEKDQARHIRDVPKSLLRVSFI